MRMEDGWRMEKEGFWQNDGLGSTFKDPSLANYGKWEYDADSVKARGWIERLREKGGKREKGKEKREKEKDKPQLNYHAWEVQRGTRLNSPWIGSLIVHRCMSLH